MRKLNIIIAVAIIAVTAIVNFKPAQNTLNNLSNYKTTVNNGTKITKMMSKVDSQLTDYKERYTSYDITTNTDIAERIKNFKNCEFQSVTSVVETEGQLINCAEVTDPKDVAFFSTQTKYMRFKLKVNNLAGLCKELTSSVLAVHELHYRVIDSIMTIEVNTMFSDDDKSLIEEGTK